jgi:hypothetical protein
VDFQKKRASFILSFFIIFSLAISILPQTALAESDSPYEKIFTDESGRQITMLIIPTVSPQEIEKIEEGAEADVLEADVPEVHSMAGVINVLENVPAFSWCYGCSPTSAAMLFGYYDRTGYSNMYTGPTNGGVCPLYNSIWGYTSWPSGFACGECPLSASHRGIDGRATNGHVDDYWVDYNCTGPDPYDGHWAEHTPDCLADYMGTNQAKYNNDDGSTTFYYGNGDPLYDYTGSEPTYRDGCHGMRLFAESRGYTVVTNFNQLIQGQGSDPNKGFTFADFQTEIDAGRPVLLYVYNPEEGGHSMLGYGYDTSTNTIYIHDTWNHLSHTMTWGGNYSDMQLRAVTVFQLEPPPEEGVTAREFVPPSTYAKIPFAIVQSGFTLVGEILDIASWEGMPWLNSALTDTIGSWIGGPLSWSVDMLAWGVGILNCVVGLIAGPLGLPSWITDVINCIQDGLTECYSAGNCTS